MFVSFYRFLFLTHKAFQVRPVFLIGSWSPNYYWFCCLIISNNFVKVKYFSTYKSMLKMFFGFTLYFLCCMQKHLEQIELELVKRIYKEFLLKFDGNKSEFAKASICSETTVRRVFRNEQRMTVDLFLRFCFALGKGVNEIFEGINILNEK